LLESATYFDNNFKQYKNCKRLDDYYIPARCPNALPGDIPSKYFDDEEEVKQALRTARKIIDLTRKKLSA
jgi:HEPN domain-containing protein